MKFWLSKNSEIPVREQLTTQITIGVLSGDLAVGDKLPSTQEIARRFRVHANTVRAAYQELAAKKLVEFRKGSGFYISRIEIESADAGFRLEIMISDLLKEAKKLGFSSAEIAGRLQRRLAEPEHERLLVIESDESLRKILIAEIEAATDFDVEGVSYEDLSAAPDDYSGFLTALEREKPKLDELLGGRRQVHYLSFRSVSGSLTGQRPPSAEDITAVISDWQTFLVLARTMLVAAGVAPETLIVRANENDAIRSVKRTASLIICDALAARRFSEDGRVRVFQLIAEASMAELITLNGGS